MNNENNTTEESQDFFSEDIERTYPNGSLLQRLKQRPYWNKLRWLVVSHEETAWLMGYLRAAGREVYALYPDKTMAGPNGIIADNERDIEIPLIDVVITGFFEGYHISPDRKYLSIKTQDTELINTVRELCRKQKLKKGRTTIVGAGTSDQVLQVYPGNENTVFWPHELIILDSDEVITNMSHTYGKY